MNEETLSERRGEVIEGFVNIESIINAVISQHYFKKQQGAFILEVLYDERFSFALKRSILEKIIPSLDNKKIHDLNRLNTIRNYFAHCAQEWVKASQKPGTKGIVPDPRKKGLEGIDFERLYKEFMEKRRGVEEYLWKILRDIGGVYREDGSPKLTMVGKRGRPQQSSGN